MLILLEPLMSQVWFLPACHSPPSFSFHPNQGHFLWKPVHLSFSPISHTSQSSYQAPTQPVQSLPLGNSLPPNIQSDILQSSCPRSSNCTLLPVLHLFSCFRHSGWSIQAYHPQPPQGASFLFFPYPSQLKPPALRHESDLSLYISHLPCAWWAFTPFLHPPPSGPTPVATFLICSSYQGVRPLCWRGAHLSYEHTLSPSHHGSWREVTQLPMSLIRKLALPGWDVCPRQCGQRAGVGGPGPAALGLQSPRCSLPLFRLSVPGTCLIPCGSPSPTVTRAQSRAGTREDQTIACLI